ncbi:MAG TPA: hypothetical protein VFM34_10900 [Moraxellaceae bacterium]|nr:hypothetical protein [Moraxellaceae bacterium]
MGNSRGQLADRIQAGQVLKQQLTFLYAVQAGRFARFFWCFDAEQREAARPVFNGEYFSADATMAAGANESRVMGQLLMSSGDERL